MNGGAKVKIGVGCVDEPLFFAEDFEGFLAEDAVAGDPAGEDGEGGGGEEGGEVERDLGFEGEVERGEFFDGPGDAVGEEDADRAGDEAKDGELDGEDGGDAGAGGAERLEDDDLADAAVLGPAMDEARMTMPAKMEKPERNWTT